MDQPKNIDELDKIIERKEEEKARSPGMVRKILFVLFPRLGWGVSTIYNKKDNKFWLSVVVAYSLVAILIGIFLTYLT